MKVVMAMTLLISAPSGAEGTFFGTDCLGPPPPEEQFMNELLSHYSGPDVSGAKLGTARELRKYFVPKLVEQILRDRRTAKRRGEVPGVDGDPIVGARDWQISDLGALAFEKLDENLVQAAFSFKNFGKPATIKLDLDARYHMRIAEIHYADTTLSQRIAAKR